jgi:hypothetical protein
VGLLRAKVKSPEEAITAFRNNLREGLGDARRRGLLTHELYFRLTPPGDASPPELLAVAVWQDLKGMLEHYQTSMGSLAGTFAGEPEGSIWEQPKAIWSEW